MCNLKKLQMFAEEVLPEPYRKMAFINEHRCMHLSGNGSYLQKRDTVSGGKENVVLREVAERTIAENDLNSPKSAQKNRAAIAALLYLKVKLP